MIFIRKPSKKTSVVRLLRGSREPSFRRDRAVLVPQTSFLSIRYNWQGRPPMTDSASYSLTEWCKNPPIGIHFITSVYSLPCEATLEICPITAVLINSKYIYSWVSVLLEWYRPIWSNSNVREVCVCVSVSVSLHASVCVCVSVCARTWMCLSVSVQACGVRERACVSVSVSLHASVRVCLCACVREHVCACMRERVCVWSRVFVYLSLWLLWCYCEDSSVFLDVSLHRYWAPALYLVKLYWLKNLVLLL